MSRAVSPLLSLACLIASGSALPPSAHDRPRLLVLVSPAREVGASSIVAFDIGPDGIPLLAESYSTDGTGRAQNSPQAVVSDAGGRFVFAANNESHSIAVFDALEDGTLEPVAGSPFPVEVAGRTYSPVFIAPAPDASSIHVAAQGALVSYRVSAHGALVRVGSVPLTAAGLEVSPDGRYLYAAGIYTDLVYGYRIDPEGALEELGASPFAYDAGRPYRVVVSADGSRVWVLDLDTGIASFEVGRDGTLVLAGQTDVGAFSVALESVAHDRYLYAAPPFEPEIRGFAADGAAPVALPGSPFPAPYTGRELLASADGRRLYQVTAELSGVLPLALDAGGELMPMAAPVAVETENGEIPNGAGWLPPRPFEVAIDVLPGSARNPVRSGRRGVLPVALLGAEGFDVTDVNRASLHLGPGGTAPVHDGVHGLRDVNGDGLADLVLHFRVEETVLACGDAWLELTGYTLDGRRFAGRDDVAALGCGGADRSAGPWSADPGRR